MGRTLVAWVEDKPGVLNRVASLFRRRAFNIESLTVAETLDPLLHRIARREGIGDLLADGVKVAAGRLGNGSDRYAIHVKGLEFAAFEPRAFTGMGRNPALGGRYHPHDR